MIQLVEVFSQLLLDIVYFKLELLQKLCSMSSVHLCMMKLK